MRRRVGTALLGCAVVSVTGVSAFAAAQELQPKFSGDYLVAPAVGVETDLSEAPVGAMVYSLNDNNLYIRNNKPNSAGVGGWYNLSAASSPANVAGSGYVTTTDQGFAGTKTLSLANTTSTLTTGSNLIISDASSSVWLLTPTAAITVTLNSDHLAGRELTLVNLSTAFAINVVSQNTNVVATVPPATNLRLIARVNSPAAGTDWGLIGPGVVVPGASSGLVSATGLPGTTTNGSAPAGYVGEYVFSVPAAAVAPLGTMTYTTITSFSGATALTPGDWDVWGTVDWSFGTSAGNTVLVAFLSGFSNLGSSYSGYTDGEATMGTAALQGVINVRTSVGPIRVTVPAGSTQAIYLNAAVNYTTLGTGAYQTDSILQARRRR